MYESAFGHSSLISGSDPLLVERAVKERVKLAKEQVPAAEINIVPAIQLDGHQLTEITGSSLFSREAIAVIEDIGQISPDLINQLVSIVKNPGESLILIMTHPGGVKGRGVIDKLKRAGVDNVTIASLKPWEIPNFVLAEAKRRKVALSRPAAQILINAVGTDLRALAAAINQLGSDAEGQKIDEELIVKYFAGRAEITSFSIADAIMSGNSSLALERLRWALDTGVSPVLVTSAVIGSLRTMGKYLDAKYLTKEAELARTIGSPPWKIKEIARNSKNWNQAGIAKAIKEVARADIAVKGAISDPEYALERMVLTILANQIG